MLKKHETKQHGHPCNWQDQLNWGDIVLFRFPFTDGAPQHTPEIRPCAIHDVSDIAGVRLMTLVCGIETDKEPESVCETQVTSPDTMAVAGLAYPTGFDHRMRITVSANHDGFCPGPDGTPVIGRLVGMEHDHFNDVRARIHAETDQITLHRQMKSRKQESTGHRSAKQSCRHDLFTH